MCNVCFREFKGWCKSFTKTEAWLVALEFILLVLCIAFLLFLILHVIVCQSNLDDVIIVETTTFTPGGDGSGSGTDDSIESGTSIVPGVTTTATGPTKRPYPTVAPGVKCTWTPSAKTEAVTHYYDGSRTSPTTESTIPIPPSTTEGVTLIDDLRDIDSLAMEDKSDGEDADESLNQFVLALVKVKPPRDITFGCILTVISRHWTLTAASCIESIEEVDSLDSFVMMEGYGASRQGLTHAVSDVQIHHLYQGANSTYDIAALKCQDSLSVVPVELPTLVDYFLVTIGERFTVLGYGGFRTITKGASERALRQVYTYTLPRTQCPQPAGETWSPRHLVPGRPVPHPPCATAPLCSGVLYTRGTPCNYCSGTPLIRNYTLYGIMSDNQQCGVSCEPALYVNVAVVRDWIDFVMEVQ